VDDLSTKLAAKLAGLSEASIDKLREVIGIPFGTEITAEDGRLLRAHISAAIGALNTQVRVDAMRMRAIRADRALEELIAMIRAKELVVPCDVTPARDSATDALSGRSLAAGNAVTTAG
jgi:hypothetical protein